MNHSASYRIGAVLSTMLLVGAFPSALFAQTAQDASVESKILANARLGEIILQEDFSKIENGGMPEGWIKNHPFNFLWAAEKATGLNGDVISVQNHKLAIRSDKGAHIIALPPLGTENYVFSATFQFIGRGGSFGLETDIADDYKNCSYATNSMMYPYEVKDGEFAQFVRKQGRGDIGRQNIDCSTGYFEGALPDLNTDVVFTVYHLEGVSYFYCNGKFVSQLADSKRDSTAPPHAHRHVQLRRQFSRLLRHRPETDPQDVAGERVDNRPDDGQAIHCLRWRRLHIADSRHA
jgi:hypothetical protein